MMKQQKEKDAKISSITQHYERENLLKTKAKARNAETFEFQQTFSFQSQLTKGVDN